MEQKSPGLYVEAGVDTNREEEALRRLVQQVRRTWPPHGLGRVMLDIGYFANVIELGGLGLALTADGVGTKVLIAQMMNKYDTVGIDCVAMNVNDLLCVGATPISMVDYLALDEPDPEKVEALARGLAEGAEQANISIAGGEMAQLRDIITGFKTDHAMMPKPLAFDLAGMAVGTVLLDKIIIGQNIESGDAVIGIESNGIHSNGLSLARHVFFDKRAYSIGHTLPGLPHSLGEELLKPTYIYVKEILDILRQGISVKALIHITSDGFLNLTRVESKASYVIEQLPPRPDIFSLIHELGQIESEEMFSVYNMGIGFCIIVPEREIEQVISIVGDHQKKAYRIGYAIADGQAQVEIRSEKLLGKGKKFRKIGS
jgi:phosphoribosylformylglycinamidine cyclo-ligase